MKGRIITGDSIDEVWQQITGDLDDNELGYSVIINHDRKVFLNIDIDPGGGFEGGYQTTSLQSQLLKPVGFKFALHHQGLLDEVGKFFGMEDIETGYPEFDKKVIIKTNDTEKVKSVFYEKQTRIIFEQLIDFTFHITQHHIDDTKEKADFLELDIEEAITDTLKLRRVYNAFHSVLVAIESE